MSMLDEHRHKHPTHDFDGIVENRETRPPAYFTALFYGLILWGVIFSAYYLLSGWSSADEFRQKMDTHQQLQAQRQPPAPGASAVGAVAAKPPADTAAGKELYASHCAACHGAEGKGGIGPDLTRPDYKYGRTPEAVAESIRNGRPAGMPAFGSQLSAAETESLTAFVLSLK
ncbi:MAG TPA: c-type cytochrome [Desulfuromonadales bacterium]|nr:c-type cytochrome [Desulfuromonadales bacterium]